MEVNGILDYLSRNPAEGNIYTSFALSSITFHSNSFLESCIITPETPFRLEVPGHPHPSFLNVFNLINVGVRIVATCQYSAVISEGI